MQRWSKTRGFDKKEKFVNILRKDVRIHKKENINWNFKLYIQNQSSPKKGFI